MRLRPGLTSPALTMMLLLLLAALRSSHVAAAGGPSSITINSHLRGLAPTAVPLYPSNRDFECLDGSQLMPFEHVNDDYCDCADGSDEPGTAACINGSFYCENTGYRPTYIPSSWVNDGVCDCCDASDEYASDIQCSNNCDELGREAWLEAQRAAELAKKGNKLRLEYISKGKQLKTEIQAKLSTLRPELEEAERSKKEFEVMKTIAEERETAALEKYKPPPPPPPPQPQPESQDEEASQDEAEEYFRNILDSDSSGTVTIAELQTRVIFDKDRNGEVSREEALFFLNNQEELTLQEFIDSSWATIKPFLMMEKGLFKPAEKETEDESEHSQGHDDDEEHDDEEHDDEDHEDEEHPGEVIEQHESDTHEQTQEVEKEPTPQYDEETQALVDEANQAREKYRNAERAALDLQSEIHNLEERIERDYGPDEEFASLDGACFEYQDLEYIYSLCPFGRANQRSKSGGSEVNLGIWNDWTGQGSDKYTQAKYDRGLTCWNGPARSVIVNLKCAEQDQLLAVSEPSRCEYAMEFSTPAVCRPIPGSGDNLDVHDEL